MDGTDNRTTNVTPVNQKNAAAGTPAPGTARPQNGQAKKKKKKKKKKTSKAAGIIFGIIFFFIGLGAMTAAFVGLEVLEDVGILQKPGHNPEDDIAGVIPVM